MLSLSSELIVILLPIHLSDAIEFMFAAAGCIIEKEVMSGLVSFSIAHIQLCF